MLGQTVLRLSKPVQGGPALTVEELAEWLSGADITLFFAGTIYAVARTSVVENWPRATSKRLSADLLMVAQGTFEFSQLEHLLPAPKQEEGDEGKDGG
jgi:hypothetical protein